MDLKYYVFLLCLLIFAFLKPFPILANTYYFQDEFNEERLPNLIDSSKWATYQNSPSFVTTIQESGGGLQLSQQNNKPQFPLIISKNALPDGDFFAEIRFRFTKITYWGTGIALSEQAPTNGGGFNKVLTINIWQDKSVGPNMRIGFGNDISQLSSIVYTAPINTDQHTLSIERRLNGYFVYLDSRLVYTLANTSNQLKYIWMGNPSTQNPPIPEWSTFRVDYVRVIGKLTPFLDLPWDYESKGLSFNEAALSINSFFDHQYPLLSRGLDLSEPATASGTIVNYLGEKWNSDQKPYSKHDGYDWGNLAKAKLGDWVLAAAPGTATYVNSCSSCGNMIVIDHGNGYQTRYMHLQKEGLITDIPNQPTPVPDRQRIGKVGFTGNVWPNDERGAHIHFGVFQNKNGDDSFNDNEPDGVTDPFGWQSDLPDPWENYTFSYLGQNRTGNKSTYLWKNNLIEPASTITPSGNTVNAGNYTLTFPQNSTNQNIILNAKSTPVVQPSNNLVSIGSTLLVKATDTLGNIITNLQNPFTLILNFGSLDLSKIKIPTLSLYSSPDGVSWTKEITTFPAQNIASAQINHLSYFALLGERKDTTPPTTTADLSGTQGQPSWFRSDVQLTLDAQDNEEGLGVYYTLYRVNGDEWQVYELPIDFSNEGHYKVEFYSVDNDDNTEEEKAVEFNIDKTPPEAKIYFDNQEGKLSIIGLDSTETIVTSPITPQHKNDNDDKPPKVYKITDQAGNTLEIKFSGFESNKKEGKSLIYSLEISSLKYNGQQNINLADNRYLILYNHASNRWVRLLQEFSMKDKTKIRIRYNPILNKSEIFTFDYGREKLREKRNGLVILYLSTKNGNLEFSY